MRWGLSLLLATFVLGCGGSASSTSPTDGGAGAGAGGSSGAGGSGGSVQEADCTSDADCTLVNDCCSCMAVGPGETAPACGGGECFAARCSGLGVGPVEARCAAGRCVLSASCNKNNVTCKSLPSPCPDGELHAVTADGCWGGCIPVGECSDVSACSDCDASNQVCVADDAFGSSYHCASLSPKCGSDKTCACFGNTVCVGGYNSCNDQINDGAIHCECPAC